MKIYVDKLPERCAGCIFGDPHSGKCRVINGVVPRPYLRADNCPLAELPEMKNHLDTAVEDAATPAIRFAPPRNNTGAE